MLIHSKKRSLNIPDEMLCKGVIKRRSVDVSVRGDTEVSCAYATQRDTTGAWMIIQVHIIEIIVTL